MATIPRQFCRCIQNFNRRIPSKRKCNDLLSYRQLSTTSRRLAPRDEDDEDAVDESSKGPRKPFVIPFSVDLLSREERESYDALPIAEQNKVKEAWLALQPELDVAFEANSSSLDDHVNALYRDPDLRMANEGINDLRVPKKELGYWGDDEDDEFAQVPDGDDGLNSDMTSIAHEELTLHREIREYARLAAWDMPFLSKFAKPFQPPTQSSPLRFRYTTYMGEVHPASRKVVVEFSPADIKDLTPQQQLKLKKLVGPRYNPTRDIIKMSCEKFETPAQNKRYLGDLVDSLLTEAKDPSETFEDIPLDLRHHKAKPKPQYPEEWLLNEQKAQKLVTERVEVKKLAEVESTVDGEELVKQHVMAEINAMKPTPVAIPATPTRARARF